VWILPILIQSTLTLSMTTVALPYGPLSLGAMLVYLLARAHLHFDLPRYKGTAGEAGRP
jgi:hypothetical protein